MLEYLLSLDQEETSDLLNSRVLHKQLSILKLCSVLRVVSHQEFTQEDARVESLTDRLVNQLCTSVTYKQYNLPGFSVILRISLDRSSRAGTRTG